MDTLIDHVVVFSDAIIAQFWNSEFLIEEAILAVLVFFALVGGAL